jgi:hypothetical protein
MDVGRCREYRSPRLRVGAGLVIGPRVVRGDLRNSFAADVATFAGNIF